MFRWDSVLGGMVWEGGLKERSWLLSMRLQAGLADPWTLGVHGGVGGNGWLERGTWRNAREGGRSLPFWPWLPPGVSSKGGHHRGNLPVNWGAPSLPFLDTLRTQLACRGGRRASLG